ncbi:MAG: hypothetical protein EON92_04315 [Burkholderiales bacterium]|nr:MAG: hypothetical protein EON92_04315 [Burkholderiales bacterium]
MTILRPDPAALQSGDLVWPRADDQFVYYLDGVPQEEAWRQQRDAFVAGVAADPVASDGDKALAGQVRDWSYADFVSFPGPGARMQALVNRPWVGHVGIVDVRDGVPWVIDATPSRRRGGVNGPKGVAEQTYEEWLGDDSHLQSHVWQGRLRGIDEAGGSAMVAAAAAQIGKPYRFFRFDLDDASGFYCSKLVWLAAWDALHISLDGGGAARRFWVSPLQLMRSDRVEMLYVPPGREYGAFGH